MAAGQVEEGLLSVTPLGLRKSLVALKMLVHFRSTEDSFRDLHKVSASSIP